MDIHDMVRHEDNVRDLADDLRLIAEWLDVVRQTTAYHQLLTTITPKQLSTARRRITLASYHLGIGRD